MASGKVAMVDTGIDLCPTHTHTFIHMHPCMCACAHINMHVNHAHELANYSLESKLNQLIGFVKFYRNRHSFMHHLWLFETVTGDLRGCHRDHMAYRV